MKHEQIVISATSVIIGQLDEGREMALTVTTDPIFTHIDKNWPSSQTVGETTTVIAYKTEGMPLHKIKTVHDTIRAALTALPHIQKEETAWLIERHDTSPITYLYYDGFFQWTPDANKALRFARREDADMVGGEAPDGVAVRILEHIWSAPVE